MQHDTLVPGPAVRVLAWVWTRLMHDRLRTGVMWWLNAKFAVGVTAIVRNETGDVLLVERAARGRHPWSLPGGWIRRREQLEEAVAREVREETGFDVEVLGPVSACTFPSPRLDVAYLCRVRGGTARAWAGTLRWRWSPPDALPPYVHPDAARLVGLGFQTDMPQGDET